MASPIKFQAGQILSTVNTNPGSQTTKKYLACAREELFKSKLELLTCQKAASLPDALPILKEAYLKAEPQIAVKIKEFIKKNISLLASQNRDFQLLLVPSPIPLHVNSLVLIAQSPYFTCLLGPRPGRLENRERIESNGFSIRDRETLIKLAHGENVSSISWDMEKWIQIFECSIYFDMFEIIKSKLIERLSDPKFVSVFFDYMDNLDDPEKKYRKGLVYPLFDEIDRNQKFQENQLNYLSSWMAMAEKGSSEQKKIAAQQLAHIKAWACTTTGIYTDIFSKISKENYHLAIKYLNHDIEHLNLSSCPHLELNHLDRFTALANLNLSGYNGHFTPWFFQRFQTLKILNVCNCPRFAESQMHAGWLVHLEELWLTKNLNFIKHKLI